MLLSEVVIVSAAQPMAFVKVSLPQLTLVMECPTV